MRAAVYRGPNDVRIETVPVPRIGRNELLVKVAACGVCPTDIKKIQYGTVPPPRIFGHETAGTIVQVGGRNSEAGSQSLRTPHSDLRVGDRVALHHHVPCMDCHACRHRAFAQCETYKRTGITAGFEPAGGGFAEYVRVMSFVLPGVVKIPAKNSFEEGAMLEPVNTVLKAVNRLNLLPGDNVLVAGQGPIGLMFTRLLQLRGINVVATDLLESRLRLAKKFGAKWTAFPDQVGRATPCAPQGSGKTARRGLTRPTASPLTPSLSHPIGEGGRKPGEGHSSLDAAVIAVPSDAALMEAMQRVRGGGQVLLFAHTKRKQKSEVRSQKSEGASQTSDLRPLTSGLDLDMASICVDEKDLIGSYSADFTLQKEVARLVFSRQMDVRDLITHRFPLEQTASAISLASCPTEDSLKILVLPGGV